MANLLLKRRTFTPRSTIGELWCGGDNGEFTRECYTLEPRKDQSQGKPYCVPPGTYYYIQAYSPRHMRKVPLLADVPGFTGIEIHVGNFPRDTEGCILVGDAAGGDTILCSTEAFERLVKKAERGTITIVEEGRKHGTVGEVSRQS